MSGLTDTLFKSKNAVGIEYYMDGNNCCILVTLLKQKKQAIENAACFSTDTVEDLANKLDKSIPVYLCINGKGIIHRKTTSTEKEENDLEKVLPNANINDFYVQQAEGYNGNKFISVARKSVIDEILSSFLKSGYTVINCSLGPFAIENIFPLMNINPSVYETIKAGKNKLGVLSGKIDFFETIETADMVSSHYTIGSETIENKYLLSFASAMQHYTHFTLPNNMESVKENKEDFFQKKLFQKAGIAFLAILLVLVITNVFFFKHYSSANEKLSTEMQSKQSIIQYYDTLKKNTEQKQFFLENTGLLESSRMSYYADRLVSDLPESIRLQKLNINPVSKKMNESEEVLLFATKKISVTGLCKKSNELNEWIKTIKNKKWIKGVTLIHYNQDKVSEAGVFSIDISIL